MKKDFDGIIFDMDGVLIDVSKSYREAIRKTASYFLKRNVSKNEVDEIKSRPGMNNDWDATYALIGDKSIVYDDAKSFFQKLYLGDGVNEGLIMKEKLMIPKSKIKSIKAKYGKTAIATGRPKNETIYALKKNKMESFFDAVVTLEDVKNPKPSPESLLIAMRKAQMKQAVYIGDSPSDIEAARRAKIPSIYIGTKNLGTIRFKNALQVIKFLL